MGGRRLMNSGLDSSVAPLGVGFIVEDEDLASRIREALASADARIAFEKTTRAWLRDGSPAQADVLLWGSLIRTRDNSHLDSIRERMDEEPLVVISTSDEPLTLRWAIERGVSGIVMENRLEKALGATLQAVHAGQLVVPRLGGGKPAPDLTTREKQALSLVIMGLTNREIAEQLFISESTVKSHLHTAFQKLGVHSRAEATRVIADPVEGYGTGILAITASGLARGQSSSGK